MLFSENPETFEAELKSILPFASSYQFENLRGIIRRTEEKYLVPLLGGKLYTRLCEETDAGEERELCRNAVLNVTVYENFTLLNTQIIPGGFARLTGENTGTLYKYQETELKAIFRKNGYDAFDQIISHFCNHLENYPEFKESDYYASERGELVPDRNIFSRYYKPVSYLVFQFLRPFIRRAEDLDLVQFIELENLRCGTLSGTLTDKDKQTVDLARPVIVCLAVAYAVDDMGVNITDSGVWMESRLSGDGTQQQLPAEKEKAEKVAENYRRIASRYLEELQKHLSGNGTVNPFIRDNHGKKTVWL